MLIDGLTDVVHIPPTTTRHLIDCAKASNPCTECWVLRLRIKY